MGRTCLVVGLLTTLLFTSTAATERESTILTAPDATIVMIQRDEYGVPHITGETEVGVYYGQGFAVAQDRLYQMEINRRAGKGRLAEMFGAQYVSSDQNTRRLSYTEAERQQQFANQPADLQTMVESYIAGVNTYLDSMEVDPGTYRPLQLADFDVEPWVVTDVVAVSQYLIRRFGAFGGQELIRLQELQNFGQEWFDQNRPINDPSAPTTIPSSLGISGERTWRWSGQTVRPKVIQRIQDREAEIDRLERAVGLPSKFGSFAVQITTEKSATGNVMLLGCPQMGEPRPDEANTANEVELTCPGLHVGGMAVAGIPGVIIGHNEDMTWTLTSGISDNTDVYIETTQDESLSFYWFNGLWEEFEAIPDTVYDNNESAYPFTIYRTVHGPVFDSDLPELQAYTYKMAYWILELDMARAFYMVSKAGTLGEFESAVQLFPVSFNVFYAGRDQTIKYWHAGRYNDRTDGVDPRLPHNGDGSEEWGGIIPFVSLPMAEDPGQGYFVNWNNKPVDWWDNGDNIPWVGWHPVVIINNYVSPIPSFTFEDLKGTPQAIGSHGTYQQAVAFGANDIIDENIVPPGQSAFVNLEGVPSPHVDDQWPLHVAWKFKDMLFGYDPADIEPPVSAVGLRFLQNEPNPFTSRTRIPFVLSKAQHVTLSVFDPAGRRIRTLLDQRVPAGGSSIWWDGTNEMGRRVPSGPYFYRLELGGVTTTRKALLLR